MAGDSSESRRAEGRHGQHHHFLMVAYGVQSHINPARALAHRLTRLGGGATRVTLCLPVDAHRRMFPSSSSSENNNADDATADDGVVSYVPYSDGLANLSLPKNDEERARSRRVGFESLSAIAAARGRPPVTCVVCTMVVPSVLDLAAALDVPLAVYWIQPAHVLAAYYHYFHGYGDAIASHAGEPAHEVSLPGLSRPLRIRDFPSLLVDTTRGELSRILNLAMGELFERTDHQLRAKFLVNTFEELEPSVLAEMKRHLDVFAVGPMVGSSPSSTATEALRRVDLFKHDDADRKRYMDWLGAQPENSVVYVSFGSISKCKRRQMEEIVRGLRQCGRPYLLVVRKDGLEEVEDDMVGRDGIILDTTTTTTTTSVHQDQKGMVVEWCNQVEVLSHPAVGCFVTHCGWNSTLEAVVCGVPIVAAPNMFDQPTIAYLVEEEWLIGAKVERNEEGVLTGTELARCVELVMGEGAKASGVRERAGALKGIAQEVIAAGGCAERNLLDFVQTI